VEGEGLRCTVRGARCKCEVQGEFGWKGKGGKGGRA
jgi:hypothetical protein